MRRRRRITKMVFFKVRMHAISMNLLCLLYLLCVHASLYLSLSLPSRALARAFASALSLASRAGACMHTSPYISLYLPRLTRASPCRCAPTAGWSGKATRTGRATGTSSPPLPLPSPSLPFHRLPSTCITLFHLLPSPSIYLHHPLPSPSIAFHLLASPASIAFHHPQSGGTGISISARPS